MSAEQELDGDDARILSEKLRMANENCERLMVDLQAALEREQVLRGLLHDVEGWSWGDIKRSVEASLPQRTDLR